MRFASLSSWISVGGMLGSVTCLTVTTMFIAHAPGGSHKPPLGQDGPRCVRAGDAPEGGACHHARARSVIIDPQTPCHLARRVESRDRPTGHVLHLGRLRVDPEAAVGE